MEMLVWKKKYNQWDCSECRMPFPRISWNTSKILRLPRRLHHMKCHLINRINNFICKSNIIPLHYIRNNHIKPTNLIPPHTHTRNSVE